jgi:hypothetical protein
MCGQRSSIAHARPSCQNTTTGTEPTFVRSRPASLSSDSDPARIRMATKLRGGGDLDEGRRRDT